MTMWSFVSVLMVGVGGICIGQRKRLEPHSLWWMRIAYTAIIVGTVGCAVALVLMK